MIIGKLKNIGRYKGINKSLDQCIEYLEKTDLMTLSNGTHLINGQDIRLNKDTYIAKDESQCYLEGHKYFLDIQIVVKGKELFGYVDIEDPSLEITTNYDENKDVYRLTGNYATSVLEEGTFAIVFPEDIHIAKIKANDQEVVKVVCKVKL